jgi:RNA polymerase sigma-70 factor (ECF subfamily)
LTQASFERLLEKNYLAQVDRAKGKFRSFLLGALNHFLADEWDRAHRQKRGGGQTFISLHAQTPEDRYRLEPVDGMDAGKLYERRWALTLFEQALARLEAEFAAAGKREQFERFQDFLLGGRGATTSGKAGAPLAMGEGAVRVAVHRMRQRYGQLVREEIAHTVGSPQEIDEEVAHLCAVLTG